MQIGVALPTMARQYSRDTTLEWCRGIDEGPFSSISCGERITFHNQELLVTNAAAAALTERVRVFVNLVVLPTHPTPVIAKQLATMDVLCDGRLTVGVGIGGREHDYRAAGSSMAKRHQRLDDGVAELRRIWSGEPPFESADPIGPACIQNGGPPILAGAMGPKALARAAKWADGVSGFSLTADAAEISTAANAARQAWVDAGRDQTPKVISGCFYALGVEDPQQTLRGFTADYLSIFGKGFAHSVADTSETWTADRVRRVLDDAEQAGVDEFILVPATTDTACLDATIDLVANR
ncbi:MAG TPA: LLM class flavin-dependent oxidoreductase [Microthrixaceae bacterium]|nr:LLM class flavin-dependent oxidoreductase [Microthrixaceae bacterium]